MMSVAPRSFSCRDQHVDLGLGNHRLDGVARFAEELRDRRRPHRGQYGDDAREVDRSDVQLHEDLAPGLERTLQQDESWPMARSFSGSATETGFAISSVYDSMSVSITRRPAARAPVLSR